MIEESQKVRRNSYILLPFLEQQLRWQGGGGAEIANLNNEAKTNVKLCLMVLKSMLRDISSPKESWHKLFFYTG